SVAGGMAQGELGGVVVAHADGGQGVKRGELVLPEARLPSRRASVVAVEVDVRQRSGSAVLRPVGSPFILIDGLGGAFPGVVVARHEGEDVFEVGDGGDTGT